MTQSLYEKTVTAMEEAPTETTATEVWKGHPTREAASSQEEP